MKVYITNKENYLGGPKTFMGNLAKYIQGSCELVDNPLESDILFFPISFDIDVLREAKKRGIKIVQRLDSVYYPERKPDYLTFNAPIQEVYSHYADHVVFQSQYSRRQCFKMLGPVSEDKFSIIINGTDKSVYHSNRLGRVTEGVKLITSGSFRFVEMIEPIINAIEEVSTSSEVSLLVIGNILLPEIEALISGRPYIYHRPEVDANSLSSFLRNSDIFVYTLLNTACPNSVIEAVSCGLPVVGFNSGALPELLDFSTDLLADSGNEIIQQYEVEMYKGLKTKLQYAIENLSSISKRAMDHSSRYDMKDCALEYMGLFEKLLSKD